MKLKPGEEPGLVDGRLWWEWTSDYWELPFYSELGLNAPPDRDDALAAREQLFAIRAFLLGEFAEDPEETHPMLPEHHAVAVNFKPDI